MASLLLAVLLLLCGSGHAYVYDRCELARELRYTHGISRSDIPTWVCIAWEESKYDTQAIGRMNSDGSADHGIFQINDRYWCDVGSRGCGVSCATLRRDMDAMMRCVRMVHGVHGFSGWTTYPRCYHPRSVDDCWGEGSRHGGSSGSRNALRRHINDDIFHNMWTNPTVGCNQQSGLFK
ncbi:lysozyme 2-like isoform X3 [Frankliniella occidentalis]|uniref:lysozyme n=1 Tax=Frankliniella occidentalis TaxID=133901 RepID=A0A6J1SJ90_FRAOC|nr:lysozyme 2-like isoform X2 [Frankliniella occidentalis]XP_052122720.1 lysozyme 2-like isoform X3 [Frankliniella occidentalis]